MDDYYTRAVCDGVTHEHSSRGICPGSQRPTAASAPLPPNTPVDTAERRAWRNSFGPTLDRPRNDSGMTYRDMKQARRADTSHRAGSLDREHAYAVAPEQPKRATLPTIQPGATSAKGKGVLYRTLAEGNGYVAYIDANGQRFVSCRREDLPRVLAILAHRFEPVPGEAIAYTPYRKHVSARGRWSRVRVRVVR